jgi:hypothetical protein
VDGLYGLKENVIIGKLIPAGTGYRNPREQVEPPRRPEPNIFAAGIGD